MYYSAFRECDDRTAHEIVCDYWVRKAQRKLPKYNLVGRTPQPKGIKRNNYSNEELKKLLTK